MGCCLQFLLFPPVRGMWGRPPCSATKGGLLRMWPPVHARRTHRRREPRRAGGKNLRFLGDGETEDPVLNKGLERKFKEQNLTCSPLWQPQPHSFAPGPLSTECAPAREQGWVGVETPVYRGLGITFPNHLQAVQSLWPPPLPVYFDVFPKRRGLAYRTSVQAPNSSVHIKKTRI